MQPTAKSQPTGITIITILIITGGIFTIVAGIALALGTIIPSMSPFALDAFDLGVATWFLEAPVVVGAFIIAQAIVSFIVAYGLMKGLSWAWTVTIILSIIDIVLSALYLAIGDFSAIVGIIISGIILYYLYRPNVKAYFGKQAPKPDASSAA